MATESDAGVSPHIRGVTVTTLASLAGITAGTVSALVTTGASDQLGLSILLVSILLQFPILYVLGIDPRDFGIKDNIYVAFMTFVLWFITWGIFLTAETFS
jgi:dolichol kinase